MDHIWGAPSRLKKSLSPIFLKKLAIILRQDFLRTLYIILATKPGDRILVAVSGGESSVSLLHMLQQGVTADHKKLLFTPLVLWIDEGCVYGHDIETRRGSTRSLVTILSRYGFSIHEALLEDYNSDHVRVFSDPEDVSYNEVNAERMATTIGSLHDRSSRDELLLTLRRSVMLGAAAVLGCDKILVGDTGTRLAVELMSSVASGVGGSLPHRVGFRDKRGAGGAEILRPMRELSSKEVSLYCFYNRLETWHGQEIQGVGDTIRNVTQEFLVGLQVRKKSNKYFSRESAVRFFQGTNDIVPVSSGSSIDSTSHNSRRASPAPSPR